MRLTLWRYRSRGVIVRAVLAALALCAISACGHESDENVAGECRKFSPSLIDSIASGAKEGIRFQPRTAAALNVADIPNVYLVAVRFSTKAPGHDDIGVWVTNSLAEPVELRVFNDVARRYTDWPESAWLPESVTQVKAPESAVKDCVSGPLEH